MRILFAVLSTAVLMLAAASGAHAQAGVPEVERYFNTLRTLQARFVQTNPNGSINNIAGICSEQRNVCGLMPHPERAAEAATGSGDGIVVLASVVDALATHGTVR